MRGHGGPHTPTNGLAVSPGSRGTQANPSQHVYCRPGRHTHLPVPWGRRTSGTAGRQSRATETARYGAPCGRRDPRPLTTPVIGQVGSWGIHNNPPSRVNPPRSIATHQKPSLGSGKFGGKRGQIRHTRVVEGVVHGRRGPHTPTNGIAVSPGSMGTQANPSQHVYCCHGRPNHLPVPWGRPTSGTAPPSNLGPLSPHGMMHRAIGGTHSRIRWPWLGVGGPGASTKTLDHAWNAPVLSPHPKTPRSQVANLDLAEIKPKSGAREWSRV